MAGRYGHVSGMPGRLPRQIPEMSNVMYRALLGQYFVGYADGMYFEKDKNAWAMLYNPPDSGVNLFVTVWTVTELYQPAIRIQIWLNARMPGQPSVSPLAGPTNYTIRPLPQPRVRVLQASNAGGEPMGGMKAFSRRIQPGETVYKDEESKWILPPGGNFALFLSNTEGEDVPSSVRVGFGWWEEKV